MNFINALCFDLLQQRKQQELLRRPSRRVHHDLLALAPHRCKHPPVLKVGQGREERQVAGVAVPRVHPLPLLLHINILRVCSKHPTVRFVEYRALIALSVTNVKVSVRRTIYTNGCVCVGSQAHPRPCNHTEIPQHASGRSDNTAQDFAIKYYHLVVGHASEYFNRGSCGQLLTVVAGIYQIPKPKSFEKRNTSRVTHVFHPARTHAGRLSFLQSHDPDNLFVC